MILTRKILQRFSGQAGRVFLWQKNEAPKQIKVQQNIKKVACGSNHTIMLGESGKVYTFGNNKNGQLGHGHTKEIKAPTLVQYFQKNHIQVKDVVCGDKHSIVLDDKGQLYSFGYGGKARSFLMSILMSTTGPLGHGSHALCLKPTKIKALQGKSIERITCGRHFNTAIDSEGNVYNWGTGQYGAFGDGQNKNYNVPTLNSYFNYLKNEEKLTIKKVKSSESYSVALLSDGKLYGWGSNESGQMGIKSEIGIQIYEIVNFPTEVIRQGYENQKVLNFDISQNTLLFQLANGELWWTGMKMAYKPQKVKLSISQPKLFAAGNKCFAVVDQQNNIFTNLDYVKGKFTEDLASGVQKASGQQLFGGQIIGIGGQYQTRYAIVK